MTDRRGEDMRAMLDAYVALVDAVAASNKGDLFWWGTPFAARNRFMFSLDDLLKALKGERPSLPRRLVHAVVRLRDIVTGALRMAARARGIRRAYAAKAPKGGQVYLIKSFSYASSVRDGEYRDAFFGPLRHSLAAGLPQGVEVLTVVTCYEKGAPAEWNLAGCGPCGVVPWEVFLTPREVVGAGLVVVWKTLFHRLKVPGDLAFGNEAVGRKVAGILRGSAGQVTLLSYLQYLAARNLARRYQLAGCAITYEGNPWERLFVSGVKSEQPGARIVGCQHAAVPLSAAGVFPGPYEAAHGPLPDVVLTTGVESAEIIREYGSLPPERVKPACALRYDYSDVAEPTRRRKGSGEPFTVLVALEGVPQAADLVAYTLEQAKAGPDVRFRIRPHPLINVSRYLDALGVSLDSFTNVEVSAGVSVAQDMAECDALLYWGTTVCLEALMDGMPVIHFDRGDPLSYDPLFRFTDFKWVVRNNEPLAEAVNRIRGMNDEEYGRRSRAGRDYVQSYFHPQTDDALAVFFEETGVVETWQNILNGEK